MTSAAPSSSSSSVASPSSPPAFDFGSWVVHKFGGTSLATSECYANSADIVRSLPNHETGSARPIRKCIVVSAMGEVKTHAGSLVASLISARSPGKTVQPLDKVTNYLIKCTAMAAANDQGYLELLEQLKKRHIQVVSELLASDHAAPLKSQVLQALESDFNDLTYILRAVWLSRSYDLEANWWFGFGEIWSARLMAAYLTSLDMDSRRADPNLDAQDALFVDAREIVTLQGKGHKDPTPDHAVSRDKLAKFLQNNPAAQKAKILVVTGYIASTSNGTPTTLGRDGSDYSASIFAALLQAMHVTIWTDVDGVYSANPTQVKSAVILPEMSYDEASELAYFGAKVLHPKTMTPVVVHDIPIWIRNTFNASHPGSCIISGKKITAKDDAAKKSKRAVNNTPGQTPDNATVVGYGVRGFSEISNLCLIILEGTGMIGVPGVCARLFTSVRAAGLSVVLITQAGSEHSICLALPAAQGPLGLDNIRREFRDELASGEISTVELKEGVACLAIVGDGMRSRRGAAARLFAALADAGINVMAIAQGSSERNISVIISQKDVATGLKAVHQAFLSSEPDKEYSPLLGGLSSSAKSPSALSLPAAASSSSAPKSPHLSVSSSGGHFNLGVLPPATLFPAPLEVFYPLPLAQTIHQVLSRGDIISKISFIFPQQLSMDLLKANFIPSNATVPLSLAEIVVAVTNLIPGQLVDANQVHYASDMYKITTREQFYQQLPTIESAQRIVCTITCFTSSLSLASASPPKLQAPSMLISGEVTYPAHGALAFDETSVLIYTTGLTKPIRLQTTLPISVAKKL